MCWNKIVVEKTKTGTRAYAICQNKIFVSIGDVIYDASLLYTVNFALAGIGPSNLLTCCPSLQYPHDI